MIGVRAPNTNAVITLWSVRAIGGGAGCFSRAVITCYRAASNLIKLRGKLMPKQISSRTAITSAISGLVLGAALLTLPIAAVAGSVVTLWHTEPNPKTVGVMKEIIADY